MLVNSSTAEKQSNQLKWNIRSNLNDWLHFKKLICYKNRKNNRCVISQEILPDFLFCFLKISLSLQRFLKEVKQSHTKRERRKGPHCVQTCSFFFLYFWWCSEHMFLALCSESVSVSIIWEVPGLQQVVGINPWLMLSRMVTLFRAKLTPWL